MKEAEKETFLLLSMRMNTIRFFETGNWKKGTGDVIMNKTKEKEHK